MSNKLTIGIDHGYSMMKTPNFAFPSGVEAYDYKPYTDKNTLEYGGMFYVVGSGHQPLQKDKTATEDYYLMTLAAIAKEIDYRNAERTAEVRVAAGLPLTGFGREMEKFRKYLRRDGRPVSFRYEGRDYNVAITDVSMFPQGYAAILTQGELLKEPSVVVGDLGGWTFDLMRLDRRLPDASTCRSLELGVIRCLDEIEEQVRRKTGLSVTTAQIESVLRGEPCGIRNAVREVIDRQAEKYVRRIVSSMMQSGLDVRTIPTIFLGGGAGLVKRYAQAVEDIRNPVILDDILLNAKAYERLAERLPQNGNA